MSQFKLLPVLLAALLCGCHSVILARHSEADLLTEDEEIALGAKAFQQILETEPKSQNAHLSQMVERVGQRIAAVAERTNYEWEFILLARPTQNAFCLPGGKVAIYEGVLPVCQNEAGLAVVMSHEIAHCLARHGAERMSHQISHDGSDWTVSKILGHREAQHVEMIKSVYGAETKAGVALPFSRTQESEADSLGLTLMARAGYDPQEAPRYWQRFRGGVATKIPVLLSNHPSDEKRIAKLNELVPRAQMVYQSAPQRYGLAEQIPMTALQEIPAAAAVKAEQKSSEPATETANAAVVPAAVPAPIVTAATPPQAETVGVTVTVAPIVKVESPAANLGAPTVDAAATPAAPIVQASAEAPANVPAPNAEAVPPPSAPAAPASAAPVTETAQPAETTLPAATEAPLVAPDEWIPHES